MKKQRWGGWTGGVVLLAALLLHLVGRTGSPDGGPPPPAVSRRVTAVMPGVGSCSAVACHGRAEPLGPPGILRNEYTTWIGRDRHAEAFQTLYSKRSRALMKKLGGGEAHSDKRCLACHATPTADATAPKAVTFSRDGVGCESCHGPAGPWLGPHTTEGWERLTPTEKESKFGMTDLSVLSKRAEICAGCHVGSPARDGQPLREVNHDLIAAGHPRLDFEFSAFMASMPSHWDSRRKAPDNLPDFPARCWIVGQAVSRQAALALLRDRALRAETAEGRPQALPARRPTAPWPEFAEYGCFSCHHDLRDDTWRHSRTGTGAPSWGTWHFAPVAGETDPVADAAIQKLRLQMNNFATAPATVAEQAGAAEKLLGDWLRAHENDPLTADQLDRRIKALDDPKARATDQSWDDAAQRFLVLVPFSQALNRLDRQRPPRDWEKTLEECRNKLAFPKSYNSPHRDD